MPPVNSFLRWAGSKRQLLTTLSQHWSGGYTRYVEPFTGSACFFFHVQPYRALLGDINNELISTYEEVKFNVEAVIVCLSEIELGADAYYVVRSQDTTTISSSQRAARFIYLNRYCFNGLYRTNRQGKFNVPYGGGRSGQIPKPDALRACSQQLTNTELMNTDFENVLQRSELGDFVYMDPPYQVRGTRVFNEYDKNVFTCNDLQRLRIWMEVLHKDRIQFLVSYADCQEAEELARNFSSCRVTVKRNISGFAASRGKSNEMLIWNLPPQTHVIDMGYRNYA